MSYEDLLRARLVNNFWNEVICTNPIHKPETRSEVLWPKTRLSFPKRNLKVGEMDSMESFESLSLVRKFHCPNYRFFRVDLRKEKVQLFFMTYGEYIRQLKLDNCIMSLVTFQRIVNKCPIMESFEVTGLFHCITQTESLCASRDYFTLCSFKNLKTLCLESTYVRRMILNLSCQDPKKRYHVPIQELHPLVIHELLTSAKQLQWIRISGFGFCTILNIMETLVNNPIHTKLNKIEFYDISNGMNPETFRELVRQLTHVKLRIFALTFLSGDLHRGTPEKPNMDSGIQEVLTYHGTTLEELDLTHCNVTEKIFNLASKNLKFSNLKTLILKGTRICKLPRASSQLMENLEYKELPEEGISTVNDETKELVDGASRERETQLLIQARQDFGFHIFTWWDKFCFLLLGATVLVIIYQLFVDTFGEIGKPAFIFLAAGILTFVQWKRFS